VRYSLIETNEFSLNIRRILAIESSSEGFAFCGGWATGSLGADQAGVESGIATAFTTVGSGAGADFTGSLLKADIKASSDIESEAGAAKRYVLTVGASSLGTKGFQTAGAVYDEVAVLSLSPNKVFS